MKPPLSCPVDMSPITAPPACQVSLESVTRSDVVSPIIEKFALPKAWSALKSMSEIKLLVKSSPAFAPTYTARVAIRANRLPK